MRWNGPRGIVLGGTLVLSACSALTDFSGLVGDSATDAASLDATADGAMLTTADGALPGVDAGVDATPFCQLATHAFCADFDEGALETGWTGKTVDAPASISLAIDRATSSPGSFLSLMPRMAAADPVRYAVLERRFDGAWRRVVADFDVYITKPDWDAGDVNAGIVTISLFSADKSYGMALSAGATYTTFGANGTSTNADPIPADTWVHAHVDYDPEVKVTGQIGTVSYSVPLAPLAGQGGSPTVVVSLGISGYNHPAPTWQVYYDNVTLDLP